MQFMRRGLDQRRDWKVGSKILNLINRIREQCHIFYPDPDEALSSEDLATGQPGLTATERALKPEDAFEPTVLWHDNLSLDNIFVDSEFVLTGILDWECVSCLPVHQACHLPAFMQMRGACDTELPYTAPTEYSYINNDYELPTLTAYHRDTRQYEISACRRVFLQEMAALAPGWLRVYKSRDVRDKKDFEAAVQNCDNEFAFARVEKWVRALEKGKAPADISPRLHEQLYSE